MSVKERRRLVVLARVRDGQLLLRDAAKALGLSVRQTRRVYGRFVEGGDAGVVHGLRGRPGNRRREDGVREQVVSVYRERYSDFGCTLACEVLLEHHGLAVDDQTLRRWLNDAGLWKRRRKSRTKRRRRERRKGFGDLVQIDGSHHDWFEGRRPRCVLMVMVDDATSWTLARFFEAETTEAAMTVFREWVRRHGLPVALYPDRDSIYRVNTRAADEEQARTGKRPPTQFGRAMLELGVKLTCAKSPQAKGRVERMNGTLQDRLVKLMRLAEVSTLEEANLFLETTFLPSLNGRFTVKPSCDADLHTRVAEEILAATLCVKEERKVSADQCISWEGQVLQLDPTREQPSLAGRRVTVQRALDGTVSVTRKGVLIESKPLPRRPSRRREVLPLVERVALRDEPYKPPAGHPWRRTSVGAACATASAAPRPPLRQPPPTQ